MQGPLPSNIVGHQHLPALNDALTKVNDAIHEARLAVAAGIAQQSVIDNLQAQRDRLARIKATYFPGH